MIVRFAIVASTGNLCFKQVLDCGKVEISGIIGHCCVVSIPRKSFADWRIEGGKEETSELAQLWTQEQDTFFTR